jgi:hypothetical protein
LWFSTTPDPQSLGYRIRGRPVPLTYPQGIEAQ